MADYPDWIRLFYLVGTAITIPINIESSDITLNVNLVGSDIDLDVNIAAAAVTLDINFLDQSVAVFDANQWYALQALQVGVTGSASVNDGDSGIIASRTVPTGKVFFITGMGGAAWWAGDSTIILNLNIAGSTILGAGGQRGQSLTFDTPMRATAGQLVTLALSQYSGAARTCFGSLWGYDRPV